jgi:hypothetical protein
MLAKNFLLDGSVDLWVGLGKRAVHGLVWHNMRL